MYCCKLTVQFSVKEWRNCTKVSTVLSIPLKFSDLNSDLKVFLGGVDIKCEKNEVSMRNRTHCYTLPNNTL